MQQTLWSGWVGQEVQREKFEENILPWGWATEDHLQGSACPLHGCRWQSAEPRNHGVKVRLLLLLTSHLCSASAGHMSWLVLA